ncbi:MAG: hypothetical protein AB1640_13565 [bacterium]
MTLEEQLDGFLDRIGTPCPGAGPAQSGRAPQRAANIRRLLALRPPGLLVFCNTVFDNGSRAVPWGDVFALTDPPDTYRYIFTVYTRSYVRYCARCRGEKIRESDENIILAVPALTNCDVLAAARRWIDLYQPGLQGVTVRLEDPDTVLEMVSRSIDEGIF